jgi:uncharacterized protein (DUF1800 family)
MGQMAAARLLMQGTMGTSLSDLNTAAAESYNAWFAAQAAAKPSLQSGLLNMSSPDEVAAWWYNAVYGPDQLRQRMAFALSEIFVISRETDYIPGGQGEAAALGYYYDQLATNALGNFRTLLGAVSVSPEMGKYLTFWKNDIPNPSQGVQADENYAREIMQLFTVGVWQLNPDGSQQFDGNGNPIPSYSQADVMNLANVLTGWASNPVGGDSGNTAWNYDDDVFDPMACYAAHHYTGAKTIIGGVQIPAGGTCTSDMNSALNALFNHPNTGPFISKQLIQRLVTSNPSPAYVARVAAVFANNGQGVRGDLLAVSKAILTDPEAVAVGTAAGSGKLREPMLRLTSLWRTFSATQSNGQISEPIIYNAFNMLGENALQSLTVFNFFTPTYQVSGPPMAAGLVAPEFQITNEFTAVWTANFTEIQAYKFINDNGRAQVGDNSPFGAAGPNDMVLNTSAWEPYAGNATTLVNQLALVFMPGQMSPAMQSVLANYVNAIPATMPHTRVVEAASLLLSSPQYSIQR